MTEKKLTSIGVLGSNKNNISYILIKKIFISLGYEPILENDIISILINRDKVLMIFELTPQIAEKILELNLVVDIIIHTSLNPEDYKNPKIKKLITHTKYFIMNIDEKDSVELLSQNSSGVVITYGLNKKATITTSSLILCDNIQFNLCIQREIINMNGKRIEPMDSPLSVDLIGASKVYHALAAITCLIVCGIELDLIKEALLNTKCIYRKLDKIWDNGFVVLDSYCESSLDYNLALEEIQSLKYNNVYIIKGIGLESNINTIMHNLESILNWKIALNIKKIFFYKNSGDDDIDIQIHRFLQRKNIEYEIYKDLNNCIFNGIKSLKKDDLLLLLGGESLNEARKVFNQLVS